MRATGPNVFALLRSPRSGEPLEARDGALVTTDGRERYPLVGGIPVLIDEGRSAFSIEDYLGPPEGPHPVGRALRALAKRLLPSPSHNLAAAGNYRFLAEQLGDHGRVLVVGGSIVGEGLEVLLGWPGLQLIETDVAFGPRTQVICDAHSLPFADGCFDAVVCQAVLEHVADPPRAVAEIHRVLRPEGLVYSEIPFMQQVHEGAHDFTRYTLIGHRRLYRQFDCLRAGLTGGPGMALAWSIKYFVATLGGRSARLRWVLGAVAGVLVSWLKYFDRPLVRLPAAGDAAAGTFFLGRRRESAISDRSLVLEFGGHQGGFQTHRG